MTHSAIKAGRRHSEKDMAIIKAMFGELRDRKDGSAAHYTKMSDYLKALGFEDEDGDGEVTPGEAAAQIEEDDDAPAMKALDLASRCELVCEAVCEALDDLDLMDEDGEDMGEMGPAVAQVVGDYKGHGDDPKVLVYDKYAIAMLGAVSWRVPYTIEAGDVVLETPDAWVRVEAEWKPVPGAAPITGDAVKLLDDGTVVAQAVRFGSPDEPDMSEMRDYFNVKTNFWLDKWDKRPMLYHHGMDEGTRDAPVIGEWVKAWADDAGVWLQGQLDKAHKYHAAIKELARRGLLRVSTDSAPHLVQRERGPGGTHYVKTWPILAASLTVSPAEPRLLPAELKAALAALGVSIDSPEATETADRERPDGAKADDDAARRLALEIELLTLESNP